MKRNLSLGAGALLLLIAFVPATAQTRPAPTPTPRPAAAQPTGNAPAPTTPRPAATQPSVNVPATKIAVVNTEVFRDEKAGVTRYLKAVKGLDAEFAQKNAELRNLQTRLQTIADEITKLSGNASAVVLPASIQAKREEGERLQREFKYKKELADADYQKRYNEAVTPITRDIGNALTGYATQQGLTMILDISKLEPALLALNPATDVTLAFIADYNRKNP